MQQQQAFHMLLPLANFHQGQVTYEVTLEWKTLISKTIHAANNQQTLLFP